MHASPFPRFQTLGYRLKVNSTLWIVLCTTFSLRGQVFEYAFSEKQFEGSQINDIAVINDQVLLVGGITSCSTPAYWVLDTTGQFLSHGVFETGYDFGIINQIYHDTAQNKIILAGITHMGSDDVTGPDFAHAWQLDESLMLLSEEDFARNDEQSISLQEGQIIVSEKRNIRLYNYDYDLQLEITKPAAAFPKANLIQKDSLIITYSTDSIWKINAVGDVLHSTSFSTTINTIQIDSFLYTLKPTGIIVKYSSADLSIIDSITLSATPTAMHPIGEGQFEVIYIPEDEPAVVELYTSELQLQSTFELLANENRLRGRKYRASYYYSGHYHGYRGVHNYPGPNLTGIIAFARKLSFAANPAITRPQIAITGIELKNKITPYLIQESEPGVFIYYYTGFEPLHFEMTVLNSGETTVQSFGYYTDDIQRFVCLSYNGYKFLENINLEPGEEITISDSTYLYQMEVGRGVPFYLAAPNHLLLDSSAHFFSADMTTSINSPRENPTSIAIYPNPTSDVINIRAELEFRSPLLYNIYALDGRLMSGGKLADRQINIKSLQSGIYTIQIISDKDVYVSSFVKE